MKHGGACGPLTMTPRKIAQEIFRAWCAEWGVVVDVEMAADLVRRITAALTAGKCDG